MNTKECDKHRDLHALAEFATTGGRTLALASTKQFCHTGRTLFCLDLKHYLADACCIQLLHHYQG